MVLVLDWSVGSSPCFVFVFCRVRLVWVFGFRLNVGCLVFAPRREQKMAAVVGSGLVLVLGLSGKH